MGGSPFCAWGEVDLISNFTPRNLYLRQKISSGPESKVHGKFYACYIETQGRMPCLFEVKTIVCVLGICMLKWR